MSTEIERRLRQWADELARLRALLASALAGLDDSGKAGRLLLANTFASIRKYQDPNFDETHLPGWLKDTSEKLRRAAEVAERIRRELG